MAAVLLILSLLVMHGVSATRDLADVDAEADAEAPLDFFDPNVHGKLSCDFSGPFPYTASLRDDLGRYRCGAVLIQKNAVLTAASCVEPSLHDSIGVSELFLGGLDREVPIEKRRIVSVLSHENFTGDPVDGADLAIIKFGPETCLDPVPNLGRQTASGEQYVILGFGRTSETEPLAGELLFANVTNYDYQFCNAAGVTPPLDETKLCTQNPACDCAAICDGDEGGAVVLVETLKEFNDTLMGILSYATTDCDAKGGFGIMTDVQPYLNWIFRTLQSPDFTEAL